MSTVKLQLPLPPDLHAAISSEARAEGVPVSRLVRSILSGWLTERQRAQQAEELRRFAEQYAGTEIDFDPELARAGEEHLGSPWREEG